MSFPKRINGSFWVEVAPLAELPPQGGREFRPLGQPLALFRSGDHVAALGGRCPHQGAPLADGAVEPDQAAVTCPRRGCLRWRFNLSDGRQSLGLPVACPVYPVAIHSGIIWVALPDGPTRHVPT